MGEPMSNLGEARYWTLSRIISADPELRARATRGRCFGWGLLGFFALLPLLSWSPLEGDPGAPEFFRRPTPREAHFLELARAGLGATDAGRRWLNEGYAALEATLRVPSSYRTSGLLTRRDPLARAFSVHMRTGQRLRIEFDLAGTSDPRLFVDTFRPASIPGRYPVPVSGTEAQGDSWAFEPTRGGEYVFRVQPEYGASGAYTLSVVVEASLSFPVVGHGMSDIGGVFGDPRDGGSRRHNGVDIFAPHGTPVTAGADGRILAVEETQVGGKVVWLRTEDGRHALYYAHLDRQLVREGQRVRVGDTVGLVGNTGNARTTPPHLHFGVYRRGEGAVDPWYFVAPVGGSGP